MYLYFYQVFYMTTFVLLLLPHTIFLRLNLLLNCFVIIELKNHAITHQDIGQLDMYVRLYDDLKKGEQDNPTIGILLCTETDKTIARYSVLNDNKQLFASQYMNYLPSEE